MAQFVQLQNGMFVNLDNVSLIITKGQNMFVKGRKVDAIVLCFGKPFDSDTNGRLHVVGKDRDTILSLLD